MGPKRRSILRKLAWLVVASPFVYIGIEGTPYPVPRDLQITFRALACCAVLAGGWLTLDALRARRASRRLPG